VGGREEKEGQAVRTLWGESIDWDSENRDYLRVGELKAAVPVDSMIFPPLCPSCLAPNPRGVYAITVPEGYRAGLLHPIYVPHCKRCSLRAGLFRGNAGIWIGLFAAVGLSVAVLLLATPFSQGAEGTFGFDRSKFITWPYIPFFWLGVAGVLVVSYLLQRKGLWVYAVSEDAVILNFKHPEYCDQFRKANRISGVRKAAEELADWEARLCHFCSRPLQRGQEVCSFCGRKVPAGAPARVQVGAATDEPAQLGERVAAAAQQTIAALAERATPGGVKIEEWPKTVTCQCARRYRIRHPGTYHCVDPQCKRTFIVE
jgi:hypothetical protein